LFDLVFPFLRRAAELQATQFHDQQLQVFDFRIARSELFLMREDLLTQRQNECL
jgi:hypothetical protein